MLEICSRVTPVYAAKAKAMHEKKNSKPAAVVTAVFEEDSVSDDSFESAHTEEVNEYVHPDLSFPAHLKWTCAVDAPATCTPTPVSALIDHGCPPVLISSDLVEILCLEP
jgi:hypothetical protein